MEDIAENKTDPAILDEYIAIGSMFTSGNLQCNVTGEDLCESGFPCSLHTTSTAGMFSQVLKIYTPNSLASTGIPKRWCNDSTCPKSAMWRIVPPGSFQHTFPGHPCVPGAVKVPGL